MSEAPEGGVTATVRRLWKYDYGYDVQVVIASNGMSFELEVETELDDPAEAVEATRRELHRLGLAMARLFAERGSLK